MDFKFVKRMHKINKKVIKYAIFLHHWVYFQGFQHSRYWKVFKIFNFIKRTVQLIFLWFKDNLNLDQKDSKVQVLDSKIAKSNFLSNFYLLLWLLFVIQWNIVSLWCNHLFEDQFKKYLSYDFISKMKMNSISW